MRKSVSPKCESAVTLHCHNISAQLIIHVEPEIVSLEGPLDVQLAFTLPSFQALQRPGIVAGPALPLADTSAVR